MELLIPGLILVALMAWASTKIKKRAAEAFEPELIETENYSLQKPEGFLHVLNSEDHDFEAYSKEFDQGNFSLRRAMIEIDVIRDIDLKAASDALSSNSDDSTVTKESEQVYRIEIEETANENPFRVFYKLVSSPHGLYRLRFAVSSEHVDDYLRRIDETLDSFTVKAN